MTRLEYLASFLDQEPTEFEKKNLQEAFINKLDFWGLCINAKYLLLEQKGKNDKD